MLVVRIELWPHGDKTKSRCLGTAEIANIGGSVEHGDYDVRLLKWGNQRTWKRGTIRGFPRRALGPWDLLYRALAAMLSSRNRHAAPPDEDAAAFGERPLAAEDER